MTSSNLITYQILHVHMQSHGGGKDLNILIGGQEDTNIQSVVLILNQSSQMVVAIPYLVIGRILNAFYVLTH